MYPIEKLTKYYLSIKDVKIPVKKLRKNVIIAIFALEYKSV